MKVFILLILLSMITSCSSTGKYQYNEYDNLELKHVSFVDVESQGYVTRQYYLNTETVYKKHIESGQINSLKKWSCFGDAESVNYINILKRYVPAFRTLATEQKFKIKYRKVDAIRNTAHSRIYTEAKTDEISVKSKNCWIKDDEGVKQFVISEIYR